jgi:hypothetical protein
VPIIEREFPDTIFGENPWEIALLSEWYLKKDETEGVEKLPAESAETHQGKSENQEEEEGGEDSLERAIKDLQDALNQSQEPLGTKSEEEEGGEDSLEHAIKDLQDTLNQSEEPVERKSEEEDSGEDNPECWLREYQDTFKQSEEPMERESEEDSIVEKQLEKTENPEGEDGGEYSLERVIKDYQDTLNQSEPAEWRLEEESIVPTDGSDGKVTEAHEIKTKSPEDENPTIPTIVEDLTNHENQEANDKSPTKNEETTETPKQDEYSTGTDKWTHTTNEENQPLKCNDRNLDQPEEHVRAETETFWNAIIDLEQTLEQEHGILENKKRTETSENEKPHSDHYTESEARINEGTKHQEEGYSCLRLSDNPEAFIKANHELFVKEGITLENNEAKLDEKTTLRLNEKEGLTIIHGDQNYKITMVETEKIGDMELNRYKTKQGEEFFHIPSENKVAPPHETSWYALRGTTSMYLEKNYQRELLKDAIDKAVGVKALQQELDKVGAHTHRDSIYDYWSGRANGMFTEKLIPILRYLNRDLDEPNKHIRALGKGEAIENPKLPFKLDTTDGARLLAARLSDGTLYTTEGRGPRFSYRNNDEEQRNRVAESLRNVFGEINTKYIHYTEYGRDRSLITTLPEIVGHVLMRAGAVSGEVIKQNPDIPTFIRQGTKEMKQEYMRQVFGDEGTVRTRTATPEMSRAVDVTHRLSEEQRKQLERLSERWDRTTYPDGREVKYTWLSRLPDDIQKAADIRPRLLESEARMLREDFGIQPKISTGKIYAREGGYSLMCALHISKEDTRIFCKEIGFPQQRKQEKLENVLKNDGVR